MISKYHHDLTNKVVNYYRIPWESVLNIGEKEYEFIINRRKYFQTEFQVYTKDKNYKEYSTLCKKYVNACNEILKYFDGKMERLIYNSGYPRFSVDLNEQLDDLFNQLHML